MKMSYLRGFPNEIKIINKAVSGIMANLKKSAVPLSPENIQMLFEVQKSKDSELAIAVQNYEKRLGKKDEHREIKRMTKETILSLLNLLQLENEEDLESILNEINEAKEVMTIMSLFGTASFFIAEFAKSSQLKDNSSGATKMAKNVKSMLDDNKEKLRTGIKNRTIDEKAGFEVLTSLTKSKATVEEHSMHLEDQVRLQGKELSLMLSKMEKTERMFHELKKHHIEMVKKIDTISEETRTDLLTGMLNWKGFNEAFHRETAKIRRYKTPLSLSLIRIKNLAEITDELGPPIRDKLLVEVVKHVRDITRTSDICGRLGEETIAVLFANTTLENSKLAVENLYKILDDTEFTFRGTTVSIVLNIAVSQCDVEIAPETIMENVEALLQEAEAKDDQHIAYP